MWCLFIHATDIWQAYISLECDTSLYFGQTLKHPQPTDSEPLEIGICGSGWGFNLPATAQVNSPTNRLHQSESQWWLSDVHHVESLQDAIAISVYYVIYMSCVFLI